MEYFDLMGGFREISIKNNFGKEKNKILVFHHRFLLCNELLISVAGTSLSVGRRYASSSLSLLRGLSFAAAIPLESSCLPLQSTGFHNFLGFHLTSSINKLIPHSIHKTSQHEHL
ncbi:hypothetical protein ABXS71_07495 [Bacillus infantis]|uniref:hypothetical protein n=1 Tax=Bacillus infantis TaxID=324767 RepID=UPI00344DE00D